MLLDSRRDCRKLDGLAEALARSNLESARVSMRLEVNHDRDGDHRNSFPEKQSVEVIEPVVPRTR